MTNSIKKYLTEIILFATGLFFSTWLMFSTFSYSNGTLLIASHAWSDFASHIPLIRSFSLGSNFPPEYPLYAGPIIKYHFLFYACVGLLEKMGVRIDYALNIPSALGFFALLIIIFFFAKTLFHSKIVGVLSVIFFLFNGSLSFLYFFKQHLLSPNVIYEILANKTFSSFDPYGPGIVSAFWNLNIYTNQRHLALSLALSLFMFFFVIKSIINKKKLNATTGIILGTVLGISFFLNIAVFLMSIVVLICFFILFPPVRRASFLACFVATAISLPQYLSMQTGGGTHIQFSPGYLIHDKLSLSTFFIYWFYNLGLHALLIPLGLYLTSRTNRKIFFAFFALFVIGNLFQFAPEMAANHKFFNYFMLIGNMFSAYVLVFLWNKHMFFKLVAAILFFFLVFSGIIDFFPIYNDFKVALEDYPKNKDVSWILKNTPPNAVFFTNDYLYTAPSLAGRKLFLGWPYFAWSQGYDTNARGKIRNSVLSSNDKNFICGKLRKNHIEYVGIVPLAATPDTPATSEIFSQQFTLEYQSFSGYRIYSVNKSCR